MVYNIDTRTEYVKLNVRVMMDGAVALEEARDYPTSISSADQGP